MNNKITFSESVKREVSNLEFDKKCAFYILFSIFQSNKEFVISSNSNHYVISTQYNFIVRLIKKLFTIIDTSINFEIKTSNIKTIKNKKKFILEFYDCESIDKLFNNFMINETLDENSKRSIILGAFLISGSIYFSSVKSNYHFEIRSTNLEYLEYIAQIMNNFSLSGKIIQYRNSYKLYIKKSESISDILKLFGTTDTLYEFEDFRIQKDFSNSLQRMNNLDISNINKTIVASNNQIKWIQTIINKYAFDQLDERAKIFCKTRMKNPEESLSSISNIIKETYDVDISRTSLNHIVRRIELIYKKLKE